jgi:hypothetical protein
MDESDPLTINIEYNNNEIAAYDTLWPSDKEEEDNQQVTVNHLEDNYQMTKVIIDKLPKKQ